MLCTCTQGQGWQEKTQAVLALRGGEAEGRSFKPSGRRNASVMGKHTGERQELEEAVGEASWPREKASTQQSEMGQFF